MKGDDPEIKKLVLAAWTRDPRLDFLRTTLDVDGRKGHVVITGVVPTPRQKFLAQRIAERVAGVRCVANLAVVESRQAISDEAIAQSLDNLYWQDGVLRGAPDVEIVVEEGTVHLQGTVPSLVRKRLAGAMAWWVPGVRDVVNDLRVRYPEDDGNEQIADAVKAVLEKDPWVDSSDVAVHVTGRGVVTLTGVLRGEAARQMAESDAWYVDGVREVINLLGVEPPASEVEREQEHGR